LSYDGNRRIPGFEDGNHRRSLIQAEKRARNQSRAAEIFLCAKKPGDEPGFALVPTTCYLSGSAPIETHDTKIISTPDRIRRRSRITQVICVVSASRFGKLWCDICRQGFAGVDFMWDRRPRRCDRRRAGLVTLDFEAWWDFNLGKYHRDSSSRAEAAGAGFPNRNADGRRTGSSTEQPAEAVD
jgi:hypothetical protein